MSPIMIRDVEKCDNLELARIIRNTLEEYGANKPGTVYFDPTTDHLSDVFTTEGSKYYVAIESGKLLGGGGIFPTEGLPNGYCELVKLYLIPEARGRGIGNRLMEKCVSFARSSGYTHIYLETLEELREALKLYEKHNFKFVETTLGNSGHYGCGLKMVKAIG